MQSFSNKTLFCVGVVITSCIALYVQNVFSAEVEVVFEEAHETYLWEGSLHELSTWLIEAATADGNLDVAGSIKDRVNAGERISKIRCRQFLDFAAEIASNFRENGNFIKAEELCNLLKEALVQVGGENSTGMATVLTLQGAIAVDCNRFVDARQDFNQAIDIYHQSESPEIKENLVLWFYLGYVEIKLGSLDRAEEIFQELLAKTEEKQDLHYATSLASLIDIYSLQGDMEKSSMYIRKLANIPTHHKFKNKSGVGYIISRVAMHNSRYSNFEEANKLLKSALQFGKRKDGLLSVNVARRHQEFAEILVLQNKTEEAREHLQQAIDIRVSLHGKDHKTVHDLQSQLYKLQSNSNTPILSLEEPDISKIEDQKVIPSSLNE